MENKYRTYLIQRLQRPFKSDTLPAPTVEYCDALLAGGTVDRRLVDMRSAVFGFDYMGSSEFEWGAIPKALRMTAAASRDLDLKRYKIKIKAADIGQPFRGKPAAQDAMIYLLCQPQHREHAEDVIRSCAKGDRELRLQEPSHLVYALNPVSDMYTNVCGWFELDNGFWFFTDAKMYNGVCALFGVK